EKGFSEWPGGFIVVLASHMMRGALAVRSAPLSVETRNSMQERSCDAACEGIERRPIEANVPVQAMSQFVSSQLRQRDGDWNRSICSLSQADNPEKIRVMGFGYT